MFLTKIISNLNKKLIKILKCLKPIYFLSSPPNKIGRIAVVLGDWTKGFTVMKNQNRKNWNETFYKDPIIPLKN